MYYAKLINGDDIANFDMCEFKTKEERDIWVLERDLFPREAMTEEEAQKYIESIHPVRNIGYDGITWVDDDLTVYYEDGFAFEII